MQRVRSPYAEDAFSPALLWVRTCARKNPARIREAVFRRLKLTLCIIWTAATCGLTADNAQTDGGAWATSADGTPVVSQTDRTADEAAAWLSTTGTGTSWRCLVEPGPFDGAVGIGFGAQSGTDGVCDVVLNSGDGGTLILKDPAGNELWRDQGIGWAAYSVLCVEAVLEPERFRVQLFEGNGTLLLAQSPWLQGYLRERQPGKLLRLSTAGNTARFCLAERAQQALAEVSPNNPSALRVPRAGDDTWAVTGGGAWRWQDQNREVLLQTRKVERTTAFQTEPLPPEGTWTCRIRLDRGTCGGGMAVHANRGLSKGCLVWLGGTYGDGALMLYQYPLKSLWSGKLRQWKWDTDYVLAATISNGRIQATLYAADGKTVIDRSREIPLTDGALAQAGMLGYQTWRGTGRFATLGEGAAARESAGETMHTSAAATDLGRGWTAAAGNWTWKEHGDAPVLAQTSALDRAAALCQAVKGAQGTFRCTATSRGAEAVSLLFQRSPNGDTGFECRLSADSLQLRDAQGNILWSGRAPGVLAGGPLLLEGVVGTDRVKVLVRDPAGKILAESLERYVSDTNNDRAGILGVSCEGGAAEFRHWQWQGE